MSADRELLALAARAVGGVLSEGRSKRRTGPTWDQWEWTGPLGITINGITMYPQFNDGDALWLAVKLRMLVEVDHYHAMANGNIEDLAGGADPLAATRRAILRAAAEIGRAMP